MNGLKDTCNYEYVDTTRNHVVLSSKLLEAILFMEKKRMEISIVTSYARKRNFKLSVYASKCLNELLAYRDLYDYQTIAD